MEFPKFTAPTISISSQTSLSSIAKSSIPSISSPTGPINISGVSSQLSLSSIASNAKVPTSLSGAASSLGVPTTVGGISSALGGPTSLSAGLSSAGIPTTLPNISAAIPNFSATLPTLPTLKLTPISNFPGLDQAGILLGAGPKFAAEKIAKLKSIVPPFAPGLKLNMGMVAGALSVIKAISSANPSELLKQITSSIADDIKGQVGDVAKSALDSTGISNIQGQIQGLQSSVESTVSGVTGAVQENISTVTGAAQDAAASVTNPIQETVSNTTSTVNDKISALSFPPSG
jgi:DNA-binding FrmR family transcriptional regulator